MEDGKRSEVGEHVRKHWLTILLSAIIVLMGVEILYLVRRNSELREIIRTSSSAYHPLAPSDRVPSFTTTDLNGKPFRLRYAPKEPYTLMVWFSASCSACDDNFPFWDSLFVRYHTALRMVGVCPDSPEEAKTVVQEHNVRFPVVCFRDDVLIDKYKRHILPQTVLITPEGVIQEAWYGTLQEMQKDSIRAALVRFDSLTVKGGDGK